MENNRSDAIAKNEMYYFTGAACKKGHITKRYARNGSCYECLHPPRTTAIVPYGEILSPSTETAIAVRSELDQTKLALIERKLSIEERKLALKELRVEDRNLRLQDRAERIARRERQSVVRGKMVDVLLYISLADYDQVINLVWAYALMRDHRILRVDVVTGRERDELREKGYICRCFPEDKLEIMRVADEIRRRNHPSVEVEMLKRQKKLTAEAEAESNWPQGDPH